MNNVPLPMKSPAGRTPQKAYKHVKFMPLAHVRRVLDIRDNDGKKNTRESDLSYQDVVVFLLFVCLFVCFSQISQQIRDAETARLSTSNGL